MMPPCVVPAKASDSSRLRATVVTRPLLEAAAPHPELIRSDSTKLAKVLDADLTHEQRLQVFGGNLRRIAAPIFRQKGYPL